jgi:hypothetical protein
MRGYPLKPDSGLSWDNTYHHQLLKKLLLFLWAGIKSYKRTLGQKEAKEAIIPSSEC